MSNLYSVYERAHFPNQLSTHCKKNLINKMLEGQKYLSWTNFVAWAYKEDILY